MPKETKIAAAVLAGGKNSRLKQEKSLLEFAGKTLLQTELELLKKIFSKVVVVSSKPQIAAALPNHLCLQDIYSNGGPLAGIQAALQHFSKPVFIFGCDMPCLDEEIILAQIKQFQQSQADVLVPRHSKGLEPLHAIYAPACRPVIEQNIFDQIYAIHLIFSKLKLQYFDIEPQKTRCFFNINTRNDWQKFLTLQNEQTR